MTRIIFAIITLFISSSNYLYGKDLSGTQLLCDGFRKNTAIGIEFKTINQGIFYEIKNEKSWYVEKDNFTYQVTPEYINMTGKEYSYKPQLSRETLKLNGSRQCKILDLKSKDMDKLMNFTLDKFKKENETQNKL
jgi:hypothetical protein